MTNIVTHPVTLSSGLTKWVYVLIMTTLIIKKFIASFNKLIVTFTSKKSKIKEKKEEREYLNRNI